MFKLKKKNLIYAAFPLLIVVLLAVLIPALRNPLLDILEFPLTLATLVKREFKGVIFYHRNLTQSERLKKEISLMNYKLNDREEVDRENARLKELLSFKTKMPFKVIASRIIARSAENWSSVVIIDKGSCSGIKNGFVVINHLGLVGRVIETASSTSKIVLINDSNYSVSALIQRSRQEGLVCGMLGDSLIMRYLPKESDIQVTDTVVTSGLTQAYPKGILIGTVTSVGEEFSGLSRWAIIKPAVNLSAIEEILIIIP